MAEGKSRSVGAMPGMEKKDPVRLRRPCFYNIKVDTKEERIREALITMTRKRRTRKQRHVALDVLYHFSRSIFFIGLIVYLELVFKLSIFDNGLSGLGYSILFALPIGLLFSFFCGFFSPKVNWIISMVITGAMTLIFMAQVVYHQVFKTFMTVFSMGTGGGQVWQFRKDILIAISKNILPLLFLLLPFLFLAIFGRRFIKFYKKNLRLQLTTFGATFVLYLVALLILNFTPHEMNSAYDLYYNTVAIDLSMDRLGVITSMRLDAKRLLFGGPGGGDITLDPEIKFTPNGPVTTPHPDDPVFDTSPNIIDIDFDKLIKEETDDNLLTLHKYFQVQEATRKNKYTGMFENYNIISFTAEAFSYLAVDPDLTPTLYKLVNEGFVFKNFYNPLWGVSTSDGEYVACTGLIPKSGVWSFYRSGVQKNNMLFCLGNVFHDRGYSTRAYHNHTWDYYRRDLSHPNMGYEYKGYGHGLDVTKTWPESDLEMMQLTIPEYINDNRFHAYYMTVSGHLQYTFIGNTMATKNRSLVEHLTYSLPAKAYLACQIELDKALEYLLQQLEAAGKLENTVIVLSADHYPYGLEKPEIDELAGHTVEEEFELYKSNLIIWSASIKEPIVVDKYCSSLDILPTVLNLFGVKYDSRLLMGTDILSDSSPLILFANKSFITDRCMYNAKTKEVISLTGEEISQDYIDAMLKKVNNKFKVSTGILDYDYYNHIGVDSLG